MAPVAEFLGGLLRGPASPGPGPAAGPGLPPAVPRLRARPTTCSGGQRVWSQSSIASRLGSSSSVSRLASWASLELFLVQVVRQLGHGLGPAGAEGFGFVGGEFAEQIRRQAGVQAQVAVAHVFAETDSRSARWPTAGGVRLQPGQHCQDRQVHAAVADGQDPHVLA